MAENWPRNPATLYLSRLNLDGQRAVIIHNWYDYFVTAIDLNIYLM